MGALQVGSALIPAGVGFFLTALASLRLGIFVYRKNTQGALNQAWLQFSLATALWAAAFTLLSYMESSVISFWVVRLAHVVLSFIPPLFFQFFLTLLEQDERYDLALRWSFRIASVFAILSLTPLLVEAVRPQIGFSAYPVAGSFYGVYATWFIGSFLGCLFVLLRAYGKSIGAKRNQLRYVLMASIVGLTSFVSVLPLAFGIPIYPMGYGLLIFYALISYAIVRWRLMDISVVLKNTLIYASLYSALVGLFVVVVVFAGQLLFYGPQALDRRVLWMCVVALSIVTAVVRPLDQWLREVTDKFLFQKRFEWQKLLKEASKGMTRVTSVDHLLKLMAHFVTMRVRVTHVGIFEKKENGFALAVSRGTYKNREGELLDRSNPLVGWLSERKDILTQDAMHQWLRNDKLFTKQAISRDALLDVLGELEKLQADVCIPSFGKSKMLGFMILGEKLSGDPYTQEDLDVLSTLANEGGIALENAQLYEQLFHRMEEIQALYQKEHRQFVQTAIALAAAVDARDPYTHGHTERCAAYSMIISEELTEHPEVLRVQNFKELIHIAALLHDVGKIGVEDHILRKPGQLTDEEMAKMKEHSVIGSIILQPIEGMQEVARVARTHHERFDGNGYPDGLRGDQIPFMTRVISVADTFDAMTTDRPYRKRLADDVAVQEIVDVSGKQLDPTAVEAFVQAYEKGRLVRRPAAATQMLTEG